MAFDMTKTKVGDKLVGRDWTVVTLMYIHQNPAVCYKYELSNSSAVTEDGSYWSDGTKSDYDIIGFADEKPVSSVSPESNKVGFDMTKVKVGDKLLTRGKAVVEFSEISPSETTHKWAVKAEGDAWVVDHEGFFDSLLYESDFDIIGFAGFHQQANCSFTEMQAVELLLSLGYTLRKGV